MLNQIDQYGQASVEYTSISGIRSSHFSGACPPFQNKIEVI